MAVLFVFTARLALLQNNVSHVGLRWSLPMEPLSAQGPQIKNSQKKLCAFDSREGVCCSLENLGTGSQNKCLQKCELNKLTSKCWQSGIDHFHMGFGCHIPSAAISQTFLHLPILEKVSSLYSPLTQAFHLKLSSTPYPACLPWQHPPLLDLLTYQLLVHPVQGI